MTYIPATRRGFLSRLSQVTGAAGLLGLTGRAPDQSGALASGRDVYDVTTFGARGDGKTLDTGLSTKPLQRQLRLAGAPSSSLQGLFSLTPSG